MLDRIFGAPVLRAALLTPREFAALRGAVGYVGARLAREQVGRTEEETEHSDAMTLLTILARLQAEVDPNAPNIRLGGAEVEAACTALFWAARDLEAYAVHLRSWKSWAAEDQQVRDWLVSNFPDAREDANKAEAIALLVRTVWLVMREHQRTLQGRP